MSAARSHSFREDTYLVSNLKPSEQKSLQNLRQSLQTSTTNTPSIWGIPLLDDDEKSDVILLKFLRARDFRVQDSLQMLLKCLQWRSDFGADGILDEELGFKEIEGVVAYMQGYCLLINIVIMCMFSLLSSWNL